MNSFEKGISRVLSIQSHVVHGYCGNKSAVLPLQLLGFDVDSINSVQFTNHTQYCAVRGTVLKAQELSSLVEGLRLNNILPSYSHILTGYCGDASFLKEVKNVVTEMKSVRPDCIYVCDPVMGDYIDGAPKMYVPPDLLEIYRNDIVPLADVLVPNQYEAEQLTGTTITDQRSAIAAIDQLHALGVKTVVISSTNMGAAAATQMCIGSSIVTSTKQRYRIDCRSLPMTFCGTGDLFAALMLAYLARSDNDLKMSLETTLATIQAVLQRTFTAANELQPADETGEVDASTSSNSRELRLIQSIDDIRQPTVTIRAVPLCGV